MQDGEQAGVSFCVLQLLVDQLKHLGGTLGVNVDLGEFRPQWEGGVSQTAEEEIKGQKILFPSSQPHPSPGKSFSFLTITQEQKKKDR